MAKRQWIITAVSCVICFGLGFGASLLLLPRSGLGQTPLPVNPIATVATDMSSPGTDAPADMLLGAGTPALGAQSGSSSALAAYIDTMGNNPRKDQQQFLRLALAGMENELSKYADRMQEMMNVEKEIRVLIAELRGMAPGGDEKVEFSQEVFDDCATIQADILSLMQSYDSEIDTSIGVKPGDMMGSAEWQGIISKLESWRNLVSDLVELERYDLQEAYQDYSQAVQSLEGIQNQLYDEAMKILNHFK